MAYDADGRKSRCDASAPIVGGGQENVLFGYVIPFAHTDIIGQFCRDKNTFPLPECPCRFVQYAIAPAYNGIKKAERLTVLHDLVILTHNTQNGIAVGADCGKAVRNCQFGTAHFNTARSLDNARRFCV
ncbi:hypothetical protein D3C84_829850 [compost metagenome]